MASSGTTSRRRASPSPAGRCPPSSPSLRRCSRRSPPPGPARAAPRRVASAMTPLVLTVAVGGTLLLTGTTEEAETARQAGDRQLADLVISATAGGVPETAVTEARGTRGVAAAVGIAPTSVL